MTAGLLDSAYNLASLHADSHSGENSTSDVSRLPSELPYHVPNVQYTGKPVPLAAARNSDPTADLVCAGQAEAAEARDPALDAVQPCPER